MLELQRTVGNRAVTAVAAAGNLPTLLAVQRTRGMATALQREGAAGGGASKAGSQTDMAQVIVDGLRKAMTARKNPMQHLPDTQADMWIGILDAYVKLHRKEQNLAALQQLFVEPDDLYELLAPWGFTGRDVRWDPQLARAFPHAAVDSLINSIDRWRSQDPRQRKKTRAKTKSVFGSYERTPSEVEMYYDDQQVVAGPNRADDSDPWGPDYTGTRAARRAERERLKNEHAMGMIEGITNAGPGALAGLVAGRLIGMLPGVDPVKAQETGMAVGGMTDALIMTGAALAPGEGGGGGGNHDEQSEMRDPKRDGMTENAPETIRGTGVTGPARQPGPRGGGAYNTVKAGPVRTEAPGTVVELFKGDANMVRHSARQEWHQHVYEEALRETGQWNGAPGTGPRAPMAFRMKGGMIQVNDEAWVKEGHSIKEIIRPHQVGAGSGIGAADTLPGGAGGAGGRHGTKVGVAPGPGRTKAPGSGTRPGYGRGPGADAPMKWNPRSPSPNPPGDTVRPATFEEVKKAFEADPSSVVVGGDGPSPDGKIPDMHQYIWEYRRWWDGRPTKEAAPAAFFSAKGRIRVDPTKWREAGHDPMELIEKSQPAPDSMKEQMGHAKTLPASGGPNATMAGDD